MVITYLELDNWGKHEHFETSLVPGVVGILGENGSGKSTILSAIKFALDGNLKGNYKKRIRGFGQPGGATSAEVKIRFTKGGKEGSISKRITASTTTRSMVWEGETITSAKGVSDALSQIFGADQSSMLGAIFIDQGKTDSIVTATPAVRQTLFSDMLSLHFLQPREKQLQAEISRLEKGIVDYGVPLEMALEELEAAETAYAVAAADVAALPDSEDQLRIVQEHNATLLKIADNERNQLSSANRIQELKHRAESMLQEAGVRDEAELESRLSGKRKTLAEIQQHEKTVAEIRARLEHRATLVEASAAAKKSLESIQAQVRQYRERVQDIDIAAREQEVASMASRLERHQQAAHVFASLSAAQEKVNAELPELSAKVAKGKQMGPVLTAMQNSFQTVMSELDSRLTIVRGKMEIVQGILDKAGIQECPLCRQAVQNAVLPDEATLSAELHEISETKRKTIETHSKNKAAIEAMVQDGTRAEATIAMYESQLQAARNSWEPVSENYIADTQSLEDLHTAFLAAKNVINVYREDMQQLQLAEANERSAQHQSDTLEETLRGYVVGEMPKTDGNVADKYSLGEEIRADEQTLRLLSEMSATISVEQRTSKALIESLQNLHTELNASTAKVQEIWSGLNMPATITCVDEVIAQLETKQATRKNAIIAADTALGVRDAAARSVNSIREKIAADQKTRDIISDLKLVREAISSTGAPGDYVQYIFERIVRRTQELLGYMSADLEVSVDPNVPVTMKFQRTDDDTGYELEQDQLSGGQAARLAIALLVAIQKELLADVGFMILDEPTKHCSQLGVEQLGSLFRMVGHLLSESETQIIVVDHHTALFSAFDQTIALS